MSTANDIKQERHVLIIEDEKGRRSVALDAATYSLGRDQTNAIVLESRSVSRQHALLLRLPTPGTSLYRYRLVDGNSTGKLSVNGVSVNGKRISTLELRSGDTVMFGGHVKATYQVLAMDQAEFTKYLDMINYQSIKSLPVSAFETMIGDEEEEDNGPATTFLPSPDSQGTNTTAANSDQPFWQHNWFKYAAVGVAGMVIGLTIGGGVLMAAGQLDLPSQTPEQPASSSASKPAPKSATQPRK
jgi:pSer/pThr/pTyr-binding forkhead associated (FHA) protein